MSRSPLGFRSVKASVCPSRVQDIGYWPLAPDKTGRLPGSNLSTFSDSPPVRSGRTVFISGSVVVLPSADRKYSVQGPGLAAWNATRWPSGTHVGEPLTPPAVRRVRVPRSRSYTHTSLPSSPSTVTASWCPFGEKRGCENG